MKPRREKRCRPKSCLSRILFVLFNLPSVSWKTLFQNRDWSICSFFYFLALQAAYLAWGRCYILLLNTKLFYAAFDVVGQIDVACLLCGWFCWISEDKVYFQPLATPFPAVLKASTGEHKVSCFTHSLHRPTFPPQLSHTHLSVVQFWNPKCFSASYFRFAHLCWCRASGQKPSSCFQNRPAHVLLSLQLSASSYNGRILEQWLKVDNCS